ncbi:hypothetical protein [Aquimarina sp. 2201CG5-10]|uniref:hypothetical protein n=1 Tax=Aquimarina callyspongiae TaxID=3098150 RepID=UPI002AB5A396|nr:hypothetical protein [Aquimarina sp. 2201CG5-10]MDY8137592.1 hypothetical protein [Aquimarina sp. 2201CG5-10]
MKKKNYLEKDKTMTRAIIAATGFAVVASIAVAFNNPHVLWAWSLIPNTVTTICD